MTPGLLPPTLAGRSSAGSLFVGEHGGVCLLSDREGDRRAGLAANQAGGQATSFNDLGILRAKLACASDGGLLKLNWGGIVGVSALAMHEGGGVIVNDANGNPSASVPPRDDSDPAD